MGAIQPRPTCVAADIIKESEEVGTATPLEKIRQLAGNWIGRFEKKLARDGELIGLLHVKDCIATWTNERLEGVSMRLEVSGSEVLCIEQCGVKWRMLSIAEGVVMWVTVGDPQVTVAWRKPSIDVKSRGGDLGNLNPDFVEGAFDQAPIQLLCPVPGSAGILAAKDEGDRMEIEVAFSAGGGCGRHMVLQLGRGARQQGKDTLTLSSLKQAEEAWGRLGFEHDGTFDKDGLKRMKKYL